MTPARSRFALLVTALVAAVAFAPPAILAQDGADAEAPPEATTATIGNATFAAWVIAENGTVLSSVDAGANATFRVLVTNPTNESLEVTVNASAAEVNLTAEPSAATTTVAANASALREWAFSVPADAEAGTITFTVDATVTGQDPNATAASDTFTHTIEVVPAPVPPLPPVAPEGPSLLLIGGAAVVLLVATGGAYALMQRRRPKPQPRSSTLARMEMERKAERAKTDTERVQIQQEIQQTESQKAAARDLQILHAKRQDAQKMLDLIKKRHESGQITELQYRKLAEKKQADLDRINEEIAEVESRAG